MTTGWTPFGAGRNLILFLAMLGMGGCTRPETEAEVAGSGTELGNVIGILRSPDRSAVAGIEVQLYPVEDTLVRKPVLRTVTDAGGAFAFKDVDGAYRLLALDGSGNGVTVDSLLPSLSDTLDLQTLEMAPLGSIQGVVKSQPSGSFLSIIGTPFDTAFGGDAEFLWEGIPEGKYWLHARQSGGMVVPNSRRMAVTVVSGAVTELPDTIDLSSISLELQSSQLPYRFTESVRPANGLAADSVFVLLNGVKLARQNPYPLAVDYTLTETMLDSTRANLLQVYVHSGDSLLLTRNWTITLSRSRPVKWAYQAVRAVLLFVEPDGRPSARRPGPQGADPQRGTFRVLEKRKLAPGELEYWEWPAEAGGDASVPNEIQATLFDSQPLLGGGCRERPPATIHPMPGDTVTFFLLPDSILGAWAFRPRTDERFQDMQHLGYYAGADWPRAESATVIEREMEWRIALRPEGLRIEWPWQFLSTETGCLGTFRRFLVDSAGRVRETVATPPGVDSDRLLLHYRAKVGAEIHADSLPRGGAYVFIDSTGRGVAGSADSSRSIQLSAGDLLELMDLLAGLPNPIPSDWDREYAGKDWMEGLPETLRYLVSDQRGAMHILDRAGASPEKADLFSRAEAWLRERNLL